MIALAFDLTVRQGDFVLHARDEAAVSVLGLSGPSGAGKTTLLEAMAGIRPAAGTLRVGDRVLLDTARGIDLPPQARRVGYVPQDALLFPHLSVRANLTYGAADDRRLSHVLEMLDIRTLVDRRPAALSGGERQRVALGRALMATPALLLLDEPLAGVDPDRRGRILPYLERVRQEFSVPMLYVTHDAGELRTLADRVLLVEGGRVTAAGSPETLLTA